jgi:hypothetical protein
VHLMAAHSVHQVYVVDPDIKPLCTITVSDVLRVIIDSGARHAGMAAGGGGSRVSATPSASGAAGGTAAPARPGALARHVDEIDAWVSEAAAGAAMLPPSRLESATSAQSGERAASVSVSVQSEHGAVNSRARDGR